MTSSLASRGIAGVVLDIEGTTTPASFVYDVLFPYARARLAGYVAANLGTTGFADTERLLRSEWSADVKRGESVPHWPAHGTVDCSAVTSYLEWLMDRDRKSTGLKAIQGWIWEAGFRDGTLRGQVYDDVPRALVRWRDAGVVITIYSSGSVLAQRLLFGHSVAGDLTTYLGHYFDTAVGPKRAADSYSRIASSVEQPARRLLFISDVVEELDAAAAAGYHTILCMRESQSRAPNDRSFIRSFDEVT